MAVDLSDLTVVIPARNITGHVDQCRQLVAVITAARGSCVLVDDGSMDGSEHRIPQVASEFGVQYVRLEGVGPGLARNAGLMLATTPWVTFVDSDDAIHPEGFSELLAMMRTASAVVGRCSMEIKGDPGMARSGVRAVRVHTSRSADTRELITHTSGIAGIVLNRDWLREQRITFPVGYLGEDQAFMAQVAGQCRRMVQHAAVGYFYQFRTEGQLTSRPADISTVFRTFEDARAAAVTGRARRLVWFAATRVVGGQCKRQGIGAHACMRSLLAWLALRPHEFPAYGMTIMRVLWTARHSVMARALR